MVTNKNNQTTSTKCQNPLVWMMMISYLSESINRSSFIIGKPCDRLGDKGLNAFGLLIDSLADIINLIQGGLYVSLLHILLHESEAANVNEKEEAQKCLEIEVVPRNEI